MESEGDATEILVGDEVRIIVGILSGVEGVVVQAKQCPCNEAVLKLAEPTGVYVRIKTLYLQKV